MKMPYLDAAGNGVTYPNSGNMYAALYAQKSVIARIVPKDETSIPECSTCHERLKVVKRCSRCKITLYCSTQCQAKDWPRHKFYCK